MKQNQAETAVGVFVLVTFAVLMWGSMQIGAFPGLFGPGGYRLTARFESVAGLDPETDVLVAGVAVGKVDRIELDGHQARVTLRIEDSELEIPVDSKLAIRSRGLLGEHVLEILPGESSMMLTADGHFTRTQTAANVDLLIDRLTSIAGDVKGVTKSFRNVLGDADGEEALHEIVSNVRVASASLRGMLQDNEKSIERIVMNLDAFSSDIASPENRKRLGEMFVSMHEASQKLNQALDNLAEVSARVERGEGTLGQLVSNEDLYEEVDAAIAEVRATLSEVRRAAEETQEQIPATILTTVIGALF